MIVIVKTGFQNVGERAACSFCLSVWQVYNCHGIDHFTNSCLQSLLINNCQFYHYMIVKFSKVKYGSVWQVVVINHSPPQHKFKDIELVEHLAVKDLSSRLWSFLFVNFITTWDGTFRAFWCDWWFWKEGLCWRWCWKYFFTRLTPASDGRCFCPQPSTGWRLFCTQPAHCKCLAIPLWSTGLWHATYWVCWREVFNTNNCFSTHYAF